MKRSNYILILLSIAAVVLAFTFKDNVPEGWTKGGSQPNSYEMSVDAGVGLDGKNAATIRSKQKKIHGFGTLLQCCLPDKFLGKRIRMSGYLKTKDVEEWAGFWLRIDPKSGDGNLGFDNMHDGKTDRSVKGTSEWKKYEIVLDVPLQSGNLCYGALLSGTGQIWFDSISFEVVDDSVPVTGYDQKHFMPKPEPTNLDFEK